MAPSIVWVYGKQSVNTVHQDGEKLCAQDVKQPPLRLWLMYTHAQLKKQALFNVKTKRYLIIRYGG